MKPEQWETIKDRAIRIFGLVEDSIVDGPGLRFGIFVQGCSHHCPGCHNPESQPAQGGTLHTLEDIRDRILENSLITGVTFSGGEPFEQADLCAPLAERLKADGLDIWAYSGYLADDLLEKSRADAPTRLFLENIDVLVDSPYIEGLNSFDLKWRGSTNQRLVDMPKTLETGRVELWDRPTFDVPIPESW